MLKTKEEFHETEVATSADPQVRNDVVFFECPSGGAVFSTGSINWGAALATDGGKNDVARITRNAVDRFLRPEPFRRPLNSRPLTGLLAPYPNGRRPGHRPVDLFHADVVVVAVTRRVLVVEIKFRCPRAGHD